MTHDELIAIPTEGEKGISDKVSNVFAKTPFFTLIQVKDNEIDEINIKKNEAAEYTQGTGPIVMKNLNDLGVDVIIAGQIGPGAKTLMEISGIKLKKVKTGTRVSEAVKQYLKS